ncbi:acyl-CoA thioesterase [Dasania sp. GY-MA-18]|uniref:Acyl-CoA thioesterase n=1 Tax=Dasania phycosphaerae TaxID=2950436 RepID=A0A9J6RJ61_9GAMM|nr:MULTISPECIES: hotdog domain-containing protein [Dasania]MCR8921998.1 acyl-CoA thioesterase [Dasania sp. GY-MA-18]MCZ0864426.1 acyl-CoA thioesterase [Dasania phycosphaerae]MCZ0868154.1 acyl-CoA thioesterase [Dasania phycosphaerae]
MKFYTRRIVKPTDLNPSNTLFGGQLLSWIDEEAAIFASCQMNTQMIVTKFISEIDFKKPAVSGDVIEFGLSVTNVGTTSLTVNCEVRKKATNEIIISIDKMVFVALDQQGMPTVYNYKLSA